MTFEEWLASTDYSESRKTELRRVEEFLRGGEPSKKDASHVDGFIKLESYDEIKEARGINSRSDAFKVFSGRYFKSIEEVLYKNPWFIKKIPVPDRPKLINALLRAGFRYYENDYKSFESHFLKELMDICECTLYKHMLKNWPGVAERICDTITGVNRIYVKGGLMFDLLARRMSGDMCTSLGNSFTNLMVVLFIVERLKHGHVFGFVEGDDGLFATDVTLDEVDFRRLGFKVEIHELRSPNLGHFCGCLCSTSNEILKDPRKLFRSFFYTSSCIHAGPKVLAELQKAKAMSLAYELPQCPVLGVLARKTLSLLQDSKARFDPNEWKKVPKDFEGPKGPFRPTDEARLIVQEKFDISIECQRLLEDAIDKWDLPKISELVPPTPVDRWYCDRFIEYT